MTLQKFMSAHKAKNKLITHVSMGYPYGNYFINQDILEFWDLYTLECFNGPVHIAEHPLVETPILVDVDLCVEKIKLGTRTQLYTSSQIKEVIYIYQTVLKKIVKDLLPGALECIILEKPPYEKEINGTIFIKNGFHLHFPRLFMDREAQKIYLIPIVCEKIVDVFSDIGCKTPIDANILNVHWLLYGSSKPNNKPYKITGCVNDMCEIVDYRDVLTDYIIPTFNDEKDKEFMEVRRYAMEYMPRILSILLSGRDQYYYTTKDHIDTPIKHKFIGIKKERKEYSQRTIDETLEDAQQLLEMIGDERTHNRGDWFGIGCCLWNITNGDIDGYDLWVEFSKRSPKFSEQTCIYQWNSMHKNNYTIGTLYFFAEQDNPEEFDTFKKNKINGISDNIILYGGHHDYALLLYVYNKMVFVCNDIKNKCWYKFENHIWNNEDNGIGLRKQISDQNGIIIHTLIARNKMLLNDFGDAVNVHESTEIQRKIKTAMDRVKQCKSSPYKDNIMKEACEVFYNPLFYELLNKNAKLIAFKNGVYDFNHMEFRDGQPEDYLSTSLPINYTMYHEFSPAVQFISEFFEKVFPNPNIRNYFLDQACQVFVGGNTDKVVLFWTGIGNNGKTITQTLFEKMLGQFAIKFNTTVLTGKKQNNGTANPEMARAGGGVRWAVMEEPNPDEMINAGSLKWLSGNDTYWARDLYEKGKTTKEITPLFKLHVVCNTLPPIRDIDQAVKNRVRVIPFESTFINEEDCSRNPEEQKQHKRFPMDRDFATKKIPKMIEPLAWFLIERYKDLSFQRHTPEEVKVATNNYIQQNDIFKQFEMYNVHDSKGARLKPNDLYDTFKAWFNEEYPGSRRNLPARHVVINYFNAQWGVAKNYWLHKTCEVPSDSEGYDLED